MLYFSYGSNMSSPRLNHRITSARNIGTAILEKHSLRFHKVGKDGSSKCDAFETGDDADKVIGVLFNVDTSDVETLDRVEGLGNGYVKKDVWLIDTATEKMIKAFTYCATDLSPELKPFCWYKEHVARGAKEHGLPEAYTASIEVVECVVDGDISRRKKELSIYNN